MHATPQTGEQQRTSKEFVFRGDFESMTPARQAIMDFVTPYCAGETSEIDIFIALQEALANAVLHGCGKDPSLTVHCLVEIDPAAISITVRDPGPGFAPEVATQLTESGGNLSSSGRGICLMRSMMDQVTYREGGTEVQLRKLRSGGCVTS